MRVRVVAVGKIKEKPTRALLADYYGRIDRYARFEEVELKDGPEADVTERFLKAMEAMAQQKAEATPVQEQAGDNGSPDSKRAVGGGDAGLALDYQVSCRHVPCPVAASLPPCPGIV